jgi:hypothetical protein
MAPVTFAVLNTNKELIPLGDFAPKTDGTNILMVNGGLMAKARQRRF